MAGLAGSCSCGAVRLAADADALRIVNSGARKHYCSKCGTPLFNLVSRYSGACMIYLGAIEPLPAGVPSLNVYCESMLNWVEHVGSILKLSTGADGK